jgi:GntR family transcriptional repressor for pyruvate dehydrogenase complex
MNSSPLSSQRLYEQMAQRIREQILDGLLSTGDKLPNERSLAEQFGVSRTVVREAIKTLKSQGLVEVRPGLGTFIIDDTGETLKRSFGLLMSIGKQASIEDIIAIREMLEPEIAAMAASQAIPEDIDKLEHTVKLMDANIDDIPQYTHLDHSFHLTLAQATQNTVLPHLIASIVDLLQELRKRLSEVDGARERGQHHHRQIIEAIKRQNPVQAKKAMQDHLYQVRVDSEAYVVANRQDTNKPPSSK